MTQQRIPDYVLWEKIKTEERKRKFQLHQDWCQRKRQENFVTSFNMQCICGQFILDWVSENECFESITGCKRCNRSLCE